MVPTVHQFWYNTSEHADELPALSALSRESFLAHSGCEVCLWSYTPYAGVTTRDAAEILPLGTFQEYLRKNAVQHVADLFRCLVLLEHGGWWADMDCVCIRTLPEVDMMYSTIPRRASGVASVQQFSNPSLGKFTNSVIRAERGDVVLSATRDWLLPALSGGIKVWGSVMTYMANSIVTSGREGSVALPVLLGATCACQVPAEHDRVKYGFLWPGLASIRGETCVIDFYTKQMERVIEFLNAVGTPQCRQLLQSTCLRAATSYTST